ncbi:hypothetical protein [Aquihabitans sp. McL0605]|uniref:hypothetical protein n=1 Tax=Aquihabitans sp. McL0605 TaxID=3415671 RepID=UPI003CFB9411
MSERTSSQEPDGPYEIRLQGRLHPRWSDRFDGLAVSAQADGTTLIRGEVVDQAALHGLLRRVADLGLPLLSVTRTTTDPTQPRS